MTDVRLEPTSNKKCVILVKFEQILNSYLSSKIMTSLSIGSYVKLDASTKNFSIIHELFIN